MRKILDSLHPAQQTTENGFCDLKQDNREPERLGPTARQRRWNPFEPCSGILEWCKLSEVTASSVLTPVIGTNCLPSAVLWQERWMVCHNRMSLD